MLNTYYLTTFILSLALSIIYVIRWHKRFDVNMTALFILFPIINLSYALMYRSQNVETAVSALKIVYIGGCFFPWLTSMCIANLSNIHVRRMIRSVSFLLCCVVYCGVLSIGHNQLFYKSIEATSVDSSLVFVKEYGPLHTVFYVCVALFMLMNIVMILSCLFRKKQVSRIILNLLFLPVLTSMIGYVINHILDGTGLEIVPATYVLAQIVYLLIAHRMALYDAGDMVMESLAQSGETGFITVDFKYRYLGSNYTARRVLPALNDLTVDRSIRNKDALRQNVMLWLEHFEDDNHSEKELYTVTPSDEPQEEKIYTVRVNYLYDGRMRSGYQIFLEDDTKVQKYITLLDRYNSELEREVSAKTARIYEMHDQLILGMAAMVESRDNSTGGHIRRTSEGVRILIEEMKKSGTLPLSESFCKNVIKAAPMHDLGKITVDDAILRKPGRFTPEEFEIMKKHAAEGARIVHTILKDTDDDEFRAIAENVAHYHHERIDGTGYPDGLKGDEIPLEARIMAIADVYDALVSKRVYKDKVSFDDADRIIMDGMGKQFDERLKACYEAARPNLEAYYSADGNA